MANLGVRVFNGSTDTLRITQGNLASQPTSTPGTWMWGGRVTSTSGDTEIASLSGFDPLDFYFAVGGFPHFRFYNGAEDGSVGPGNGFGVDVPSATTDIILVLQLIAGSPAKWHKGLNSGSGWVWTHLTSGTTYSNRPFPPSDTISFSPTTNPFGGRMALFGHSSLSNQADAAVEALTATDLSAWTAFAGITNLWRMDTNTDLVGTWAVSALTGTSVTAAAFPLDEGAAPSTKAPVRRRSGLLVYR